MILGSILLTISAVWLTAGLFKRVGFEISEWAVFFIIMTGGFMFLAFSLNPSESWDLYRHYEVLAVMENESFINNLLYAEYFNLPVINILYYLVALTGVPNLLPAVTVMICYSSLGFIILNYIRQTGADSRFVASAVIFNLLLCPFIHMASGIRNVLAYSLCAAAFYNELYNKKAFSSWIIYFLALFIHPSVILILALRVMLPFFKSCKWLSVILLGWSLALDLIVKILFNIPIKFLQDIAWKIEDYLVNRPFSGFKILAVKIFFLVTVVILAEYCKRTAVREPDKKIRGCIDAFELMVFFIVGSLRIPFIADRLCYFIAFFGITVLGYIYQECKTNLRYIFMCEAFGVAGLLFVHQVLYFLNL